MRELRNYLERCLAFEKALPLEQVQTVERPSIDIQVPIREARQKWLLAFERRYLEALLQHHNGNVSQAARAAGINRTHLHYLMSRCGIK